MISSDEPLDILDYLQDKSGCSYLSDLSSPCCYWKIKKFMATCDMKQYPLSQWEYAYRYIFSTDDHFDTVEALRQSLLCNLSAGKAVASK